MNMQLAHGAHRLQMNAVESDIVLAIQSPFLESWNTLLKDPCFDVNVQTDYGTPLTFLLSNIRFDWSLEKLDMLLAHKDLDLYAYSKFYKTTALGIAASINLHEAIFEEIQAFLKLTTTKASLDALTDQHIPTGSVSSFLLAIEPNLQQDCNDVLVKFVGQMPEGISSVPC